MSRTRKAIGVFLEAWGGIRLVVDLLESVNATKEFTRSAYVQIVAVPSSLALTITVIVVGLVLLLFEPFKNAWSTKRTQGQEEKRSSLQQSAPLSVPLAIGPCIYIDEFRDDSQLYIPASPIVLHNRGDEVAHAVQILPVSIGYREISFDYVDTLDINEKKKVLPRIATPDGESNTLFYVLKKELDAKNNAQQTANESIQLPLTIICKNRSQSHHFETRAEISYFPVRREISTKSKEQKFDDWPHDAYPWYEVRHNEFTKT